MGLVDKLTELDKYIWTGFEKVTQYCNKEYGWDKYDLAKGMVSSTAGSLLGAGVYTSTLSVIGDTSFGAGFGVGVGVGLGLVALLARNVGKQISDIVEYHELKDLEQGVVFQPVFKAIRPITAFSLTTIPIVLNQLDAPPAYLQISDEKYNALSSLVFACYSAVSFFGFSALYFLDQIPTPPKKKKSVFKTLYEKVAGKLQPAPVPQLQPAKPTRYQSIDDMLGE